MMAVIRNREREIIRSAHDQREATLGYGDVSTAARQE
jgi:hypothetical protein